MEGIKKWLNFLGKGDFTVENEFFFRDFKKKVILFGGKEEGSKKTC